ncbi:Serine-pyruvate aminotransferase [Klebsiella pneumoniae]|uniref:Serine-pyruvate aminotransferase n=1 Tax=Klebsiella pneumoniae TaxID=573 RepID=A0A4P0Y359_KLEPN|nr:Serine-pyruvate aminotransferase [Klebsiella pneumoniae]
MRSSACGPRLLLTVQGDTSTTMLQPLAELGEICRRHDVLFYTDATASLGGNPLETDAWQLDAVSAGMQKCLGGPSGTLAHHPQPADGRGHPPPPLH